MRKSEENRGQGTMWVLRQIMLTLAAGFFLYFGIEILLGAFSLKEPFSFILTFFASNFIILFSAALMVGFVFNIKRFYHHRRIGDEQQKPEDNQ